jgi:hypothetical protein
MEATAWSASGRPASTRSRHMFGELEFARPYGSPQQLPDNPGRDTYPAEEHKRCEQRFQNISKSDRIAEEFRFLMSLVPKKHHAVNFYIVHNLLTTARIHSESAQRNRAFDSGGREKPLCEDDCGTFRAGL